MDRAEYLIRAREIAPRGESLPQSKLTSIDVEAIRSAVTQRERLREYIRDNLSNAALASQIGVHVRTVEKVIQGESWSHV